MNKETKRTFLVLTQEGVHEYNINVEETEKGTMYSLFASNGSDWTEHTKGKLLFSMIDHGDGIKFDRKLKNIEYDELFYLRFLLDFELHLDTNILNKEKHKIIELNTIVEL